MSSPALRGFLQVARDALGRSCAARDAIAQAGLTYVACGSSGVWILRPKGPGSYELVAVRDLTGDAEGFFAQGGELWVRIVTRGATPIARLEGAQGPSQAPLALPMESEAPVPGAPLTPARPQPPQPVPALAAEAERAAHTEGWVVATGPGYAIVNLGSADLIRDGSHIAFYRVTQEPLDAGERVPRRERVAVGIVDSVGTTRARVRLGINERVDKGTRSELTREPLSASSIAPPRADNAWDVGFLARPFLVLGDLGVGMMLDARAGYHFEDLHIEGLLLPFSVATASDGVTLPSAAVVAASYDSHLFEVGLGLGGQTVNDPDPPLRPGTGATLLQRARLGARDGLNVEVFSYVVLFHREFSFSGIRVTGQIPLGNSWLILSGGGGSMGIGFGEIGLRVLLAGNGNTGSLFMTTTVGGADMFEKKPCEADVFGFTTCTEIEYGGPMIGTGFEWRL